MKSITNSIRALTRDSAKQVNDLRVAEYAKAKGFHVAAAGILWNASDDQSIVLGAYEDDVLISTMRMEILDDRNLVEQKIECPWDYPVELQFPTMLLSRASTASSHRGTGINTLLRLHCLKIAKDLGVRQAIGTFVADSPRARTLERMGYRFFENRQGWTHADYRSEGRVIVAVLDFHEDFETAMAECRRLTSSLNADFTFDGVLPHQGRVSLVR